MRRAGLLVGQTLDLLRAEIRPASPRWRSTLWPRTSSGRTAVPGQLPARPRLRAYPLHERQRGGRPRHPVRPPRAAAWATCSRSTAAPSPGLETATWRSRSSRSTPVGRRTFGSSTSPRRRSGRVSRRSPSAAACTRSARPSRRASRPASAADGREYGIIEEYVGHGSAVHARGPADPNYGVRTVVRRSGPGYRGHRADGHAGQQRLPPRPRRRLDGRHERRVMAHWEHSVAVTEAASPC